MQFRACTDIGGGIGDGDEQGPAIVADLGVQRVIDILGLGGIDGNEFQVGQVAATLGLQWITGGDELLQRFFARAAPFTGELVFGHGVEIFYARGILVADHRQHLGLWLAVADGVAQDRTAHVVTFLDAVAGMGRDEQPAIQLRQVRLDEYRLALAHTAAGELSQRAVQQLLDVGDGLVVLGRTDTDLDPVIGEGLEHLVRRDEDFAPIFQYGETVARLGAFDDSLGALFLCLHLRFEAFQLGEGIVVEHQGGYTNFIRTSGLS